MATILPKPNTETPQANPVEEMFATGHRSVRLLSAEERKGLRRLVNNPKPPTEALREAVSDEFLSSK